MAVGLDSGIRRASLLAAAACALPLLLLLPAWLAVLLGSTFTLGFFARRPWPKLLLVSLTLMLGGLVLSAYGFRIGRDTGCAGLLAMLALKPFETHSLRDARSLLGFSLVAPFAAFLQDQGPLTLALALPATLLSAMAWPRLLPGTQPPLPRSIRRAAFALLMAAPMALAGFWLFPRLAAPMWGLPDNVIGHAGLGDRMTPNEWLDALVDDSPAMRAHFFGRTPPRAQMYWRGPVLTRFDGEAWSRNDGAINAPAPLLAANGDTYDWEVMLEPTDRHDLLVLDLPLDAPSDSRLNSELTATTADPITGLIRYRGRSTPSANFLQPLSDTKRRELLQLPRDRDPRTRALAQSWRQQTSDPLKLTSRFIDMLHRQFKYSISAPPVGYDATDDFLFNTRVGFCQHFSSAYVVFMRAAGVPARVVTGYVGGHYNRLGDYWLLEHKDAHAWAEIWLDGRGWIRVDPTAAIAPENILDTLDDLQAQQRANGVAGLAGAMFEPMFDGGDYLRRQWNAMVLGFNAARQKGLLQPLGIKEAENWQLVMAFGIGAGLALALTLLLLLREHRDRSDPLLLAWRQFVGRLARIGLAKPANEPPLSFAARVAASRPDLADEVLSLSHRYSRARYAPGAPTAIQRQALARELRQFRARRTHHRTGVRS